MGEIKLVNVSSLKTGSYLLMDGAACVVKNIQVSSPGKHGHAKYRIEGVGILDSKKRISLYTGHDKVEVPIIEKKNAQVLSIQEDTATVMDMETYETFNLKIPEDLRGNTSEGITVMYWVVLDEKIMKQVK